MNSILYKYKRHVVLTCMLVFTSVLYAQSQSILNVDTCIAAAMQNYPLTKQSGYLQAMSDNSSKKTNANWLPQLEVASRATYQSEVTSFDFPGFPALVFPKDQYNFGLHLDQGIFDGGVNSQQKRTEKANTAADIQQNEVERFKVKDMVIRLYGNILLAKENIKVLASYMEDIQSRSGKISSSVQNGAMLKSNADVLEAELLKTQQQQDETKANLDVLCRSLSLLTQMLVDTATTLQEIATNDIGATPKIARPELSFFTSKELLADEKIKLINRKEMPRLSLFGDGAYGRPGYNFLNQDFRFYGMAGLSLTWNINSLYSSSFDKKNLAISKNMVAAQRDQFLLQLNMNLVQQEGEIKKLKNIIEKDHAIVDKRKEISRVTADQLENGIITSADYLTQLSAEKQAELNQRMHEIQLGIATKNYLTATGN